MIFNIFSIISQKIRTIELDGKAIKLQIVSLIHAKTLNYKTIY